jgi:type IV pilus assembly protein PilY1
MRIRRRSFAISLLAAALLVPANAGSVKPTPPPPPADAGGDDLFLMTTSVSPNVILLMDNSESMNHIEWHPKFDPNAGSYGCGVFDNDRVYEIPGPMNNVSTCGNTRDIFAPVNPTLWDGRYLNWYFSDAATPYVNEIETAKANVEGCTQAGGAKFFDDKYRRTRFEASKQVLLDLLCVAEPKNVRFGLAGFRDAADAANEDPNGCYISEDLGRSNPNHAAELESAIKNSNVASETPLAESLFQIYSFWMSRDVNDIPFGADGTTRFPKFWYDKFGNWDTNSNQWLEDPMLFPCEKAFVVIVTDGVPTRDDFDTDPASTSEGFGNFGALIGDYNPDGETELPGDADETSWYLDDIAKYMYENDFRPDLDDDQTIDTYTIGLATDAATDAFLQKTADVGNGLFFHVQDGDELAFALIAALNDIIEKAQSFTAATVPSARTFDGGDFYQSYFFPSGKSAFWEGHIRAWHITASGDIHDKNGVCALDDLDAGECNSGPFKPSAQYYWDASEQVPPPDGAGARTLYTSKQFVIGSPVMVAFDDTLEAADLEVPVFTVPPDPTPNSPWYPLKGSTALNEEGLADEIVAFGRGCFFGTGVTSADVLVPLACAARPSRLGDIFHSNPVVVRQPNRPVGHPSYNTFKNTYAGRRRVIFAGTNAGFLEAIDAGTWDSAATPPKYTAGTGSEIFGFMPWQARMKIKNLPIDDPTDRNHYVDGSPQTADMWFYDGAADATKEASEWHTVLVGGMREGGSQYYALDVTNPADINYPGYLWEFPREDDPDSDLDFLGEAWSQPIMTRVRVNYSGVSYERWVAIVTGGYDETGNPNPTSVTGLASVYDAATGTKGRAILILDAKTGEVLAEKKFVSGAAGAQADMLYTIPSTPAVFDLNADGFADVIYVGDLGGQVFKWVISAIGEDRVNDGSGLRTQPSWPFKLFFQAPVTDISGTDYFKNFYFSPAATLYGGKLWLAFGSGERRHLPFQGVAGEDENNRFYVMSDVDPYERSATPYATLTEADLTDITGDEDGATFNNRGYYFKAVDGEKFVTEVEIFAGQVIAASFVPTPNANVCAARGDATLYVFDVRDGKGFFETDDVTPVPMRGMSIGTGLPTNPKVSVGVGGKENRVYIEKSGTDLWSSEQYDIPTGGRYIYWRELF